MAKKFYWGLWICLVVSLVIYLVPKSTLAAEGKVGADNFGSEYTFNAGDTSFEATAGLSATQFVVAYRDIGNSNYGTARVGTVSGATISYGAEYVFNAATTGYLSIAALSSSKVIITYRDEGNSNRGTAIIADISGSTMTFGSEYVFNTGATVYTSAVKIFSFSFAVGYADGDNSWAGTARSGSVSGRVITFDNASVFNAGETNYIALSGNLDENHFAAAYEDVGNANKGTAIIGTISGANITYGIEYLFNNAESIQISIDTLYSGKIVMTCRDNGSGGIGIIKVGAISGNIITFGAEHVFHNAATGNFQVVALSYSSFFVIYEDAGSDYFGNIRTGAVSGTDIGLDNEFVFNGGSVDSAAATKLDANYFIIAFRDVEDAHYGKAMLGGLPLFRHPNGTLIRVGAPYTPEDSSVYFISYGFKFSIPDSRVFASQFSWNKIVPVAAAERDDYTLFGYYPYRDGELVRESGSNSVYIFDLYVKRKITTAHVFEGYHFSWDNIVVAPAGSLALYVSGADLNSYAAATYPGGCLLKASNSNNVYVIDSGNKRLIPNSRVFDSQFSWGKIIEVDPAVLSDINYPVGTVYPYRDGELVRENGSNTVYVFENHTKRHIMNVATFEAYNYSWDNIVIAPAGSLAAYATGSDLTI